MTTDDPVGATLPAPVPSASARPLGPASLVLSRQPLGRRERGQLLILSALGLAARAFYALIHPVGSYRYSDMEGAWNNAKRFADPLRHFDKWDIVKPRAMSFVGGFFVRHFPTETGALIAWGTAQVVLSAISVPLLYFGCRRFFGARVALTAAALLAGSTLAIGFAAFLMVETWLMFCLALAFALLDPDRPLRALLAGVALGVGCLFKPQAGMLVPLWCLALFFWPSPGQLRRSFATWLFARQRLAAVLLGVGVLAAVVPETVAISRLLGRPVFLSAYGGQNFYIGHCHVRLMSMDGGRDGSFFAGVPKVYQRNEPWPDVTFHVSVFDNDFYIKEGLKCWRRSFWGSALWTIEQLADVFAGWPGSTIDVWPLPGEWVSPNRYTNLLLEYLIVPLAFVALWKRRRELGVWLTFGLPLAAVWGLALIFSGDPRYREPFDLFFFAGGAISLVDLWDHWRHRMAAFLLRQLARDAQPPPAPEPAGPAG